MIRYNLRCSNDHGFESWFKSADAYDGLERAGHVTCPECGDTDVSKTLMAPPVRASRNTTLGPKPKPMPAQQMTNAPDPELVKAIDALRTHVEKNSDYVGDKFATMARAMHEGEEPHRPIYGEAKPDEASRLREDGVPAVPLPFVPRQKTN